MVDIYINKRLCLFVVTAILLFCDSATTNVIIDLAIIFTTYNLYQMDKKDNKKFDYCFWALLFVIAIIVTIIKVLLFFIN